MHGAFGSSLDNPRALIESLLLDNARFIKRPRVYIYLDCGPCRPPRRSGKLETWLRWLSIPALNRLLDREPPIEAWSERIGQIAPLIDEFPQVKFILFPSLESNFSLAHDKLLNRATRTALIDKRNVITAVNRMAYTRVATPLEIHDHSPNAWLKLKRGDIVSGDGIGGLPTCSMLRALRARGVHYMFWRAAWQGATKDRNTGANERTYSMNRDARAIKKLMKC